MSKYFTADEIRKLREHNIVIYADRVMVNAQPPLSAERMKEIEAYGKGPLPAELKELWGLTAGGEIYYDLIVEMNGSLEPVSFNEIFYDESSGYNDLQGWIEHEIECAEEASGDEWDGKLFAIPIGGFEYCDRIYAVVEEGDEYGSIIAWKQGLPPAWKGALHDDAIATIASGLKSAFGCLFLENDPLDKSVEYNSAEGCIDYIEEAVLSGLSRTLADKLTGFYSQAVIDWKTKISNKTICDDKICTRSAMNHALKNDDASLMIKLASVLPSVDIPCRGTLRPLEAALQSGKFNVAGALIKCGAEVKSDTLEFLSGPIPKELLSEIIDKGACPSVENVVNCAATGAYESALLAAARAAEIIPDFTLQFANEKAEMIQSLKEDLDKVRKGKLGHYLGEGGLAERIKNIKGFVLE